MYSADGEVLAEYNREYPLIIRGDAVLQDAGEWWNQICIGITQTVQISGVNEIDGISVSTQGISVVPVDADGNPICEAVSWLDMRAAAETESLIDKFGIDYLFRSTGKHAEPSYTLPMLMHLKNTEPDVFAKAEKFLLPLDFINMKLTGRPVTDYTIAGGTMAFDLRRREWSEEL